MDIIQSSLAAGMGLWAIVVMAAVLIVHVSFAVGVYGDASRRPGGPVLAGPGVWCLATLMGGVFGAALYWAMHHSTLAPRSE